jgi:hypothetical protein
MQPDSITPDEMIFADDILFQDQTSPEDGVKVHQKDSSEWNKTIRELAMNINEYIDMNAYFEWITPGTGDKFPREPNMIWQGNIPGKDDMNQIARADYFRNFKNDENVAWTEIKEEMTKQDIIEELRHSGVFGPVQNQGRWLLTKIDWIKAWAGHAFAVTTFNSHNRLESNIFVRPMEKYIELWETCRKIWRNLRELGCKVNDYRRDDRYQNIKHQYLQWRAPTRPDITTRPKGPPAHNCIQCHQALKWTDESNQDDNKAFKSWTCHNNIVCGN